MFMECIDAHGQVDLTLGKVYAVKEFGAGYVKIIADDNEVHTYYSRRFIQIATPNENKVLTDNKDMKYDADKPRMDLLLSGCPLALEAVSSILTFGAKKYAAHSWQSVERGEERYLAALLRHLTAHAKGEQNDPESGMSHLAHAACNAMFILELELKKC